MDTLLQRAALALGLPGPVSLLRAAVSLVGRCGEVVVRVSPLSHIDLPRARQEVRVMEVARAAGVELAPVVGGPVLVGTDHVAIALRFIAHDPTRRLDWGRLGALLRELHQVPAETWMPRHQPAADLRRYMARADRLLDLGRIDADGHALLRAACEQVDRQLPASVDGSLRLAHGDIHTGNVLVRPDGRLVLIDWEESCAASPLVDLSAALARRELYALPEDDYRAFCRAYGRWPDQEPYCWTLIRIRAIAGITYLLLSDGGAQRIEGRRRLADLAAGRRRTTWVDI